MIFWMVYAVAVSALVGLAAYLAEQVARSAGAPTRHLWAGALVLSLVLPAAAPLRIATQTAEPPATEGVDVSALAGLLDPMGSVSLPRPDLVAKAEPLVAAGWAIASALLALTLAGGLLRLGHRARRWPRTRGVDGEFLLSDGFGPALLGVLSPEVVLPGWALSLDAERLHMVWAHEDEHRRAGDAGLLLAGTLGVVMAPWNPVLWWLLRRLRAAVELDCDARVIGRGVSPVAYGAMLLELSARIPRLPLPVAALSKPPSLLERRLTMIVRGAKRGGPASTVLALVLATALVVLACEAPPPTAVEPTGSDEAAGVVRVSEPALKVRQFADQLGGEAGRPLIYVDNVRVQELPAGLDPDGIERIEVMKGEAAAAVFGPEAANGVVQIYTKAGGLAPARQSDADANGTFDVRIPVKGDGLAPLKEGEGTGKATFEFQELKAREGILVAEGDTVAKIRGMALQIGEDRPQPDVFVNGEPFEGDLRDLSKELIERVEIVKGQEGRKDAIYITLKKSGGGAGPR
jgi:TonB-dependent SusC/RagA subfamily outer membrane receptor